jgi:hypothetical protein
LAYRARSLSGIEFKLGNGNSSGSGMGHQIGIGNMISDRDQLLVENFYVLINIEQPKHYFLEFLFKKNHYLEIYQLLKMHSRGNESIPDPAGMSSFPRDRDRDPAQL